MKGDVHPAMKKVAEKEGTPLVEFSWDDLCYQEDKIHISPHGAQALANAVGEKLLEVRRESWHVDVVIVADTEKPSLSTNTWSTRLELHTSITDVKRLWSGTHANVPETMVGFDALDSYDLEGTLTIGELRRERWAGAPIRLTVFPKDAQFMGGAPPSVAASATSARS